MIADGLPERRNLVLTSVAFIIFVAAGANFCGSSFRLIVVDVEFSRPWVLTVSAWIMLGWFLFRYWHEAKGKYLKELNIAFAPDSVFDSSSGPESRKSAKNLCNLPMLGKALEEAINKPFGDIPVPRLHNEVGGFLVERIYWRTALSIQISVQGCLEGHKNEDGILQITKKNQINPVEINLLEERKVAWILLLNAAYRTPAVSAWGVPYFLVATAGVLGLYRLIF